MIKAVLDTSVLVKSIFKPLRSLSAESYSRELETHEKCVALIKLIEERDVEVHVPKVCVVETAAVAKRLRASAPMRETARALRGGSAGTTVDHIPHSILQARTRERDTFVLKTTDRVAGE